jgi:hypothetical protein
MVRVTKGSKVADYVKEEGRKWVVECGWGVRKKGCKQANGEPTLILKMATVHSSKILVSVYEITRCHIQQDHNINFLPAKLLGFKGKVKGKVYLCNRPWRPIGL